MRTTTIALVAMATALALGACNSTDSTTTGDTATETSNDADADVEAITSPTPAGKMARELDKPDTDTSEPDTADTEPSTSPRGNLVKEIGAVAGVGEPEAPLAEWTLDAIEVDGTCTGEWAEEPELGHFLILAISVSTSSELGADDYVTSVDFNPNDFTVIGPDGVSENTNATSATFGCIDESKLLPDDIGPGENVVGKVVLDSAHNTGILTYRPWWASDGGWEWEF